MFGPFEMAFGIAAMSLVYNFSVKHKEEKKLKSKNRELESRVTAMENKFKILEASNLDLAEASELDKKFAELEASL